MTHLNLKENEMLTDEEKELYIRLCDWKYQNGRWVGLDNIIALTVDYAYMRQRWSEGFKDFT